MPVFAAAALPFTMGAIGAGATATGAIINGKMQSGAAKAQTQAANYAADQQLAAQREALDFQRQQAETTARQAEVDRRANYDQWLAGQRMNYDLMAGRERRLGSVGAVLGFGSRGPMPAFNAPAYVPGVDPHLDQTVPPAQPQDATMMRMAQRPPVSVGALLGGR